MELYDKDCVNSISQFFDEDEWNALSNDKRVEYHKHLGVYLKLVTLGKY